MTTADGSYFPLSRPLSVYVSKRALERAEVQAFMALYLDQAGALAAEVGYIPLPDEVYRLARTRIDQVYGEFALLIVTPTLQGVIPGLSGANALSAGLVMGLMILPIIASISEHARSTQCRRACARARRRWVARVCGRSSGWSCRRRARGSRRR